MQLIAMVTMLIDHLGVTFFKDLTILRVIGRIAFPIYAYCIVLGYKRTSNMKLYMRRLFWIALISQLPFTFALGTVGVNAAGTLLVCLVVLYGIENWRKSIWIPAAIAAAVVMEALDFDYGAYGLLLVLIYTYTTSHFMVLGHFGLNILFIILKSWVLELFSIFSTVFIAYWPEIFRQMERRRMPKWLWRSFYPAHLALLAVLELIIGTGPIEEIIKRIF
ncbi:TraX family protein [Paenibacillus sepulcri]|uniref:Conjugal transfer protein TraX n=1 Tax=Paenibacillus sepulcri TaxID=359917 RepID=A0ABS7CAW6_9BACL|nr:conjugal transfer protein TraX [Paenibacillus sepulcri]